MKRGEVRVFWTRPAKDALAKLPRKVRRAILAKTRDLQHAHDPRKVHKPLQGPLAGYYSMKVSRFRVVYSVREETRSNGETRTLIKVLIVLVGIRREGDRADVYKLMDKLVRLAALGLLEEPPPPMGDA